MNIVEPTVYLFGEPTIHWGGDHRDRGTPDGVLGLFDYLADVGAATWQTKNVDGSQPSDAEILSEVYGRGCYRSWKPGLNPNVTRVREGNDVYLGNIIEVAHGSVLEHAQINFMFHHVSRVFTHELVRHRVGVGISQESLRYVRLTDLSIWIPPEIEENPEGKALFISLTEQLEEGQRRLAQIFGIDAMKNFALKKKLTSAFRRVAPIGLATSIGWSANFRTIRHCIEMRTHRSAEVEIRIVFDKLAEVVAHQYPNVFRDYKREMIDGVNEWTTPNRKV